MLRVGEQSFECLVYDLSPGGARVELCEPRNLDTGTEVALQLAGLDQIASEVRHSQDRVLGLMFLHDSVQQVEIASSCPSINAKGLESFRESTLF